MKHTLTHFCCCCCCCCCCCWNLPEMVASIYLYSCRSHFSCFFLHQSFFGCWEVGPFSWSLASRIWRSKGSFQLPWFMPSSVFLFWGFTSWLFHCCSLELGITGQEDPHTTYAKIDSRHTKRSLRFFWWTTRPRKVWFGWHMPCGELWGIWRRCQKSLVFLCWNQFCLLFFGRWGVDWPSMFFVARQSCSI